MADQPVKDYQKLASDMLDPQYNQKILALRNALNSNLTNLDGSKAGINQNFDTQVSDQNRMSGLAKDNFNNNTVSRGLARSTIATSGLGGIDNTNQRLVNNINTARTSTMNDIENQKAMLKNNLENSLVSLNADKLKEALALGNQLQQQDFTNDLNTKQLEFQKSEAAAADLFNSNKFDWEKKQTELQNTFNNNKLTWEQAQAALAKYTDDQRYQDTLKQQAFENDLKTKQLKDDEDYKKATLANAAAKATTKAAAKAAPKSNAAFAEMYQAYNNLLSSDPVGAGRFLNENAADFITASDKKTFDGVKTEYQNYMDNYNAQQTKKQKEAAAQAKASEPSALSKTIDRVKLGLKNLFTTGDNVWW